jgi:hypothetical protein
MDSATTGQHAELSLWTSGHGFQHCRSACRIQSLDLWTWIPPMQVSIQNSVSGPLEMDSATTGQHAEFSLWTSGFEFRYYRLACRIQPLDLWTWIPPLQVIMQNSASGSLDMDSVTVYQHAKFSLQTSELGFRHYRSACRIWSLDINSATVVWHAEFSLWTSGHGFQHCRSGCRIQSLDLFTWIPPLQVSMQNSVSGPLDMDSANAGQHAEFSLWTSGHGFG